MPRLVDTPVSRSRSPGIDSLRAVFALWVLFGHLLPWAGHPTPWLIRTFQAHGETHPAVLGFIVLSGYCIHRNGLRRNPAIRAYATRRFFRIWPVYVLGTAVGVALYEISSDPATTQLLTATTQITVSGLLDKLLLISAVVPTAYVSSFQGNAPLVTVAAEMWLYAFYALAAVALLRHRGWWWPLAGVWLIGLIWTAGHQQYAGWWHIGSFVGFLPYWWLGAKFTDHAFVGRRLAIPAVVAWLVLTMVLQTHDSFYLVEARKLTLAVTIGALIAAIDGVEGLVLRAGAWVGRAGYSIYALHAPIIIVLLAAGVPWFACAGVAITTAMVVFYIYERPLLRLGARMASADPSGRAVQS